MKRIALTTLSLILALSVLLAACTSGGSSDPSPSNAQPDATSPSASDLPSAKGLPDKYDPVVELSTVAFTYGVPKYYEGDDMNNNPWIRHLRDTYGISVKVLWEVPSAQFSERVNLMITTGQIPDFFLVTPTQFVQLHQAGMIEDLTDMYNQYVTDTVKEVIDQAGPEVMEAATLDGRLMGIPFTGVAKESVPQVWIRDDWMKKLNLQPPKTMDELLQIANAFATRDPDGNGQHDTFGLGLDKELGMATGFFNGFHAYRGIWIEDGQGGLMYSSIQPEMRNALQKLQELYKAGIIDPEFGVKDASKVYESIGSNKLGMIYGGISAALIEAQTPDVLWKPYPIPSIDDKPALNQHGLNIVTGFWVVKKGTKHPEALIRMIDEWIKLFYLNTDDDIYKQFNYDIEKGVSHWMNAPARIYKSFKNAEISTHLAPLLSSDQPATAEQLSKLTPEEREEYQMIMDYRAGKSNKWARVARSEPWGAGPIVNEYVRNNQFKPDQFITVPTPTMVQRSANLKKMEDEMMTRVITGSPIEEFDKFVENWKKLGGDQITQEVNDWYKNK